MRDSMKPHAFPSYNLLLLKKAMNPSNLRSPIQNRKFVLSSSVAALVAGALSANAQIVLTAPDTAFVEAFTAAPAATSWSRSNAAFGNSANTITADMTTADNRVNGITGTGVTIANTSTALDSVVGSLTGTSNQFRYFQDGHVGTASTGVDASILMARIQNNTGSALTTLNLGWDLTLRNNNVATPEVEIAGHRVYWSLNGTSWTPVGNFGFRGVAGAAATRTDALGTSITLGKWNAGAPAYILWLDDNAATNPDGIYSLDNVSFTGTGAIRAFTYNLSHTELGAPNGALTLGGGLYWLDGVNPAAFETNQEAVFSQAGDATIDVPTDISVASLRISAPSGTYTIGGAGKVAGTLEKSGAGTVVLTSANTFSGATFSGGTIRVTAPGALGTGEIALSGSGGTIENTVDYTLSNVISGAATLTKAGTGTLTLSAANTHATTTISAGAAVLTGSLPANHNLNVASAARLQVNGTVGANTVASIDGRVLGTGTINGTTTIRNGATLEAGALGLGNINFQNLVIGTAAANTSTVEITLGSRINVTNALAVNSGTGTVTLNVSGNPGTTFPITYPLIDYGTISGTGFAGFVLGLQPNRVNAQLLNNATDTRVDLLINSLDYPVWSGGFGPAWALGAQGGAENWVLNSNNLTSTTFQVKDNVLFSDLPATDQTVTINGADVTVDSLTFNNATRNYTIAGANGIAGTAALIKSGAATVTISTTNSFSGSVTVSGGTLSVTSVANSGINSPLGSGSNIILDGGTLEITGASSSNRPIAVNAGNGTIKNTADVTLSGAITGTGTLTKLGSGKLTVTSAVAPASVIDQGSLEIADGAAGTGNITNNSLVILNRSDVINVPITVSGTGALEKRGTGTVTLSGALPNTYSGTTTVFGGILVAGKTAGLDAIGGNLIIDGGSFRYAAAGTASQIPDLASITLNSGEFGDVLSVGPLAQQRDTVQNVTVNGGTFGSLRTGTLNIGGDLQQNDYFRVNGTLAVGSAGTVLLQRGGGISAETMTTNAGAIINFDGGSTTTGVDATTGVRNGVIQDSRLVIGAGGINAADTTFNMNAGPSARGGTSRGSTLTLNGNFTSTGTTTVRRDTTAGNGITSQYLSAIELNSAIRTFNVTGTLNLGTPTAPISVRNGRLVIAAADPVAAPGGILKTGTGVMNLPGNQPYTGTTQIDGGTLAIDGNLSTSAITVNNSGTLSGRGTASGGLTVNTGGTITAGVAGAGSLSFPTLTLGAVAGDLATINVSRGTTPAIINVTNADGLVVNGGANSVTINLSGPNPGIGQHVLIDYAGTFAGTAADFKVGTLPNRVQAAAIEVDSLNAAIVMNVTAIQLPVWTGEVSTEWSTALVANPKNWAISGTPLVKTDFVNGDNVLFDDTALDTTVALTGGDISPNIVTFNNATKAYTLVGPGAITGNATIVKTGADLLSLGGIHTFTGEVAMNGGTVSVDTLADSNIASPLGAGTTIAFNGGTLEYTGFAGTTNRGITLGSGGGTLKTVANVTLSGLVSGPGGLTKTGASTLTMTGASTGFNSGFTITEGTVQFSTADAIGGVDQTVTLNGGTLEYTGAGALTWTAAAPQTRNLVIGAAASTISVTGAGAANGLQFTRANSLSGTGAITKTGVGTLRITADNTTLASNWTVTAGALEAHTAAALGSGTVTVETGASLITRSVAAPNTFALQNNVILNGGALGTRSGDLGIFGGAVNVAAPSSVALRSFTSPANAQDVVITGPLSGSQNLTIEGNANNVDRALVLTNPANTFTGQFIVNPAQGLIALPPVTGNPFSTAAISIDSGRLALYDDGTGSNQTIAYGNDLTLGGLAASSIDVDRSNLAGTNSGNTIELGSLTSTAPAINITGANGYSVGFSGASSLGLTPVINATTGNIVFNAPADAGGALTKTGAGTLEFNGLTNINGNVDVQGGTLMINNLLADTSDVTIASGRLSGSGTVAGNAIITAAAGRIAPGDSTGILKVGKNVTFFAGSSLDVDLAHGAGLTPVAGTDYDQLSVGTDALTDGTIDITGANLNISTGTGLGFLANDLFFIVINDGSDAITGTFANIPAAGTPFVVNGVEFSISYDANFTNSSLHGGNDIALVVPEPGSAALMLGGLAMLATRRRRK